MSMTNQQSAPAALRLAIELEQDPTINRPSVIAELRRLHAENTTLQQGYDAARLEIDSLHARVQELGAMLRENRSKRIVELEAQLEAIGAGGVEPLRRRECLHKIAEPAAVAPNWADAANWLRNNYQDYSNIASLCEGMIAASPYANSTGTQPINWENAMPGGKYTDKWESSRVADYNRGWNDYRKESHKKLKELTAATTAQAAPVAQADSQPALPEITAEDRSFLHYNPNTDDVVDWVHHYASAAIASDRASRAPTSSVLEDAARWRWLRENWFTMTSSYDQQRIRFKVGEPRWSDIAETELDAAIDAARKQGGAA